MWLDDLSMIDPVEAQAKGLPKTFRINPRVQPVIGLVSNAVSQALINRLLIFLLFSTGKQPS